MTEERQESAGTGGGGTATDAAADAAAHADTAPSAGTAAAPAKPRLSRSRQHKVAGGVCGGLGRYFDLDPVIFRVPLVVLSVVGGLGLVFYGFAWLFIPAEGDKEHEGRRLLSGRVDGGSLSAILVALVGCGLFLASLGSRSVPFSVLLVGAVAGAAYWSRHRRQAEAAGAEGAGVDPATAHAVADAPPETQAPPVPGTSPWWREPLTKEAGARKDGGSGPAYVWGPSDAVAFAQPQGRGPGAGVGGRAWAPGTGAGQYAGSGPPGTGGPPRAGAYGARPGVRVGAAHQGGASIGGLVFLLAAIAAGISTAASWSANPMGTSLAIGLSCALGVFGLGLVVSAFVGRVGAGTIVLVVLTAGLLTCAAALPKDISSDFRDVRWVPSSTEQLKPRYALGSGSGELDLREVRLGKDDRARVAARVGAGELTVVVPAGARVEVDARVSMGGVEVPTGTDRDGTVITDSSEGIDQHREQVLMPFEDTRKDEKRDGKKSGKKDREKAKGEEAGGVVELDLSVGLGEVRVVRELPSGGRSDGVAEVDQGTTTVDEGGAAR
ncbi:PspC domain-containing protein [Streptomyces albiaxialis]|uniref:PspC domain-containing protein n=1 Tax=Streptomyces albiaxialis TaxID=329523 RepID=A0ABP5HFS0_9ACTN